MANGTVKNNHDIGSDLRAKILGGRYPLNTRLPSERALAAQYGVARGTVRAALDALHSSGLVARRHGSGTYVTGAQGASVVTMRPLELIEARIAVEPHMVRLAVEHVTTRELKRLREHLRAMENVANNRAFADEDERFHLALADASRNPMMKWMMLKCHEVRSHAQWSRMRTLTLNPAIISRYNRQHQAVVDAISARDGAGAADAMRDHLATAKWSLVEALR